MTDEELAVVFEQFIAEVRAGALAEPTEERSRPPPAFRKRKPR
jgi:hypothetical protein